MVKNKGGDPPPSVSFHEFLLQAQSNGNLTGIPESYDDFIKPMMDEERRKGFHGFLLQAQSNGNLTGIPESYDDFVKPFASEFMGKQKPVGVTPAPSGDGLGRASQLPSQSQSGVPRPEQIGIEEERPVISETVQEVDFDPDAGAKASDYELRVSRDAVKIRDLTSRLGDDLAFKLLSNEPITEDEKREVMRRTAGSPFFSYAERINVDNPIESVRDAFEGEGFLNDAIEQVTLEKKQQRLSKLGQEGYEAMKADAVRFHGDKAEQVIRNTEQVIQDSFLSDTDRKISEANREINEILRKDEITPEDRKRVADLRREVNSIDDSANTLFDPATGKFISGNEYKKLDASVQSDIESFNDDVLRLSEEARNTPLDVLIDERREAYYAMKGAEKLLSSAARKQVSKTEFNVFGVYREAPSGDLRATQEREQDYREAQKRFLALNRAVALNQDPAEVERGFGDIVSRFGEGLGFDKTFDNRDYVEKLTEVFQENGIELTEGQKERVKMSFGEELASGLGATTRIGVELAFNTILANKAKALMNLPKYVRAFEAMMSTRYGKTGRLLSKVMVNAGANVEQGLLFELSGSDYATGVGENIGEGAFTKMLDLLTKGKAGVLSKKWARLIGGTGGELVGEYVGDFTSNLNELGITNIEEVMDRTFGTTMEEGARKLLLTSMIVLPLTGSVEIARAFKPKVDEAAAKYPDNEAAQEAKKMVDDVISGDATEFVKPVSEIEPGDEILKPIDLEEQTTEIDETGEQETEGRIDLGTDGETGEVVETVETPDADVDSPEVPSEETVEVSKVLTFGTPVVRDGKEGFLYQDGQRVIFDGGDIEVDLGNIDEVSDKSVSELGLSSTPEIEIEVNEDNSVVIGGEAYVNNFSNPEAAINFNNEGDVVSVNLETSNGQKRTFRGARAEAIAYQYKLKSFENEAGKAELDTAIEQATEVVKSKGFDVKVKPEGEVEITVKPRKEKVKPIKQSKDEEVKQEEGVKGSVLEGVRSGRNEKEGRQESAELRTEEKGQEVNAKNKTDLFLNARGDKAKSVKVVFKPAYDESKHSNLPENLKDELKKPKVSVFDISTDASDILELVDNPDVESIRYIKGDSDVSEGEKSQEASEPLRDVESTVKAKEQKSEVKERSKTSQKPEKPAAKERKVKDKEREVKKPLSESEKKEIAKELGKSSMRVVSGVEGMVSVMTDIFGLNKTQAKSAAIVGDIIIGNMAKRAGVSKEQMYQRLSFQKAQAKDLPLGVKLQVDGWHGSPYLFDKFTTEKIGTGEGAQAFGWGLYFADLESIARSYADRLANVKLYIDGKESTLPSIGALISLLESPGNIRSGEDVKADFLRLTTQIINEIEESIEFLKNENAKQRAKERVEELQSYIDYYQNKEFSVKAEKALYKVSLHKGKTPDQYTWLEWDKPVSEDFFNKVKNILKSKGYQIQEEGNQSFDLISKKGLRLGHFNKASNGQYFYEKMAEILSDKEVSLLLLENGIDGIKYPAESISRGATSDNARGFNYVVFDENAVSIEEVIKFQRDAEKARGAMMMAMDNNAIIYALSDPNVSTPLHELAHVYEHYLNSVERKAVERWSGKKAGTVEFSEAFARGFEKYLSEGKAPDPSLKRIFDNFKKWLTDIYNGITGSDIDLELNDEMRAIYSEMLGQEAVKPKKSKAEKTETKKQSEVKENLSKAKEELSTIFSEWKKAKGNIGAFYDPRSQAEEDVKLLKAVLNLVKAAGLKAAADIKALLKGEGVEVDDDGAEFIASKVVGEKPKEEKSKGESGPRLRKLSTIETIKNSPKEELSSFMADRTIYYQQESIVDNLNESASWINSSGRDFEDVIDVASAPSFRPGIRPSVQNGVSIIVADFLSQEIAKRREAGEDVSALSKVLMSVAEGMAVRNKDVGAALNMNKLYMVADAEVMVGAVKQRVKESRKDERAEGEFKKHYNKYKKKVGNEFKRAAKSERVTKTMSPSAEKKAKIRERRKSLLNELEELVSSSAGISFDNWQQAKKNVAISKKILQIAQTYIDEGKVDFADFYNSMSRTLGKSFKFKKADYAEIYEDLTGEIAGKISDAAKAKIKAQSALGDMSINEIIDAWIDGDKVTIDTLVETIVSKSGLTPENAKKLAEALVAEVNSMAVERETSLIKAFFKRRERSKAKTEAEKEADKRAKSLASRIDELERLNGIVDPDLLREYYGEMFGIYELDEGIFEEALKYAKAANKTRGVVREEAIKKWMKLISRAYGPPTFADFYWSMFYPSMLSGVTTHVVNIKGNFWLLAFDNIASAISPVPAFFAVIDAYKRKGSVKDAFYAFSLSNPVSSMLFRMMFIAKIQENITEATKALAYGDFDSKWTESAFTSGNMITVSPMESFSMRDAKLFGRNVYKTLIGKGAISGYESLRYVYRALASVDVLFRGFNLNSNVVPLAINYHLERGLSPLDAVRKSFEETYFLDKASRDLAKANVVEMGRAYQNATGKKLSKLQIHAAYYAEMRRQMPPQVLSKGTEIARESTLQGEMRGVMGGFGALVRMAHRINVISFLAKKAAPFVKALVNLSNIAIDSNPYGFLRAFNVSVSSLSSIMAGSESRASAMRTSKLSSEPIFYTDKKGVNKAYFRDPMFSLQIGRAMVGSISIYFAMNVFYDLFTASDDDDNEEKPFINGSGAGLGREQRRAWQKANAPYTARFWEGGPIVNYQDMPISPILAYLASYIEFERNDEKFKSKPEQERYLAAATVAAQAYLDKGFMMSLTRSLSFNDRIYQLKDFANDPLKSVAGIVKDGISPINPVQLNLFQQVEQILDPQRTSPETAGDYMAYILLGKYYAGGKKDLDYFGDPVEAYPGSYQISWNWFVDRRADPVHNFLSDYHLYGSLPEPPDFVPFNGDGLVDPTEEMEYVHKYTFGREMKRLIRDNIVNSENITDAFIDYNIKAKDGYVIRDKFDYDNLPKEEKRELLSKLIKSFKEEAATAADMTVYGSMISDVKFDYSDSEWVNEARKLLSDEIKDGYRRGKSEFVD